MISGKDTLLQFAHLILGLILATSPSVALAQPPSSPEAEEAPPLPVARIGFETHLIGFERDAFEEVSTGRGSTTPDTITTVSLMTNRFGFSIAGNISRALSAGLDARIGFLSQAGTDDVEASSLLLWEVSPFLEARIGRSTSVVPHFLLGALIRGTRTSQGSETVRRRFVGFRAGVGLHIFVNRNVSFNPRVEVGYLSALGDFNPFSHQWRFGLGAGMQVWFGNTRDIETPAPLEQPTRPQVPVPEVSVARVDGQVRAVRLVLYTPNSQMTFTFDPAHSDERLQGHLQSTNRMPLSCEYFEMRSNSVRGRSPVTDNRFEVPISAFLRAGRNHRAFARFCGRSWMNRAEDSRAIHLFGIRINEVLASWQNRASEPSTSETRLPAPSGQEQSMGPHVIPESAQAMDGQNPDPIQEPNTQNADPAQGPELSEPANTPSPK